MSYFQLTAALVGRAVNNGLPGAYISALCVDGTNLFAGTEVGVFLSTNNGTSWTAVNTGLPSSWVYALAVSGTNLFAGTWAGGVFRSTDSGTSWSAVNSGLATAIVFALGVNGTNLFAATNSGVLLSTDDGTSWTSANNGLTDPAVTRVSTFAVSGTNLFAGNAFGVFRSTNNGTSWTAVNTGLTNTWVHALVVSGTNLFAGTDGGVFLSANNGTSWTAVNTGLTNTWVHALAVSGTNLFAGTDGGVFLSTNNGISWSAVNSGLTNLYVCALAVSGTNLFAGTGDGVFRSTNNGSIWSAVSSGLTMSIDLAVSGTNLFATNYAGGVGVFLTTNNGTNWITVDSGLANHSADCLVASGEYLFAGTDRRGVWKRPLSEMVVPVELTSFTATANDKQVTLSWSTATELNNQGFEVQRKALGGEFATVAFAKGQGTTTQPNQYSFADKNLDEGKYFYRLKQMDLNGLFEYSNAIEVDVRSVDQFSLEQNHPNPFNPATTIGYVLQEKGNVKLTLLNSLGEEIAILVNEEQDKGYHEVEFDAKELSSGIYFYTLQVKSFVDTKKMILLR